MDGSVSQLTTLHHPQDELIQLISSWIAPLGYRVIHLEVQAHRQKVLRIFIDHLNPSQSQNIGIEDCVKVTKILDEPLDQSPVVEKFLSGHYELEVSSPGIDRPLRSVGDFEHFVEQRVRIHTFRPLLSQELNNEAYYKTNPKQKHFIGVLKGVAEGKVLLSISSSGAKGDRAPADKKVKSLKALNKIHIDEDGTIISLPFPLISKANLEPEISLEATNDRE